MRARETRHRSFLGIGSQGLRSSRFDAPAQPVLRKIFSRIRNAVKHEAPLPTVVDGAALGQMHATRSARPLVSRDPGKRRIEGTDSAARACRSRREVFQAATRAPTSACTRSRGECHLHHQTGASSTVWTNASNRHLRPTISIDLGIPARLLSRYLVACDGTDDRQAEFSQDPRRVFTPIPSRCGQLRAAALSQYTRSPMTSRTARRPGLASLLAISALQTACPPPWWFWRDEHSDRRDDRGHDRHDRGRRQDHDDRRD